MRKRTERQAAIRRIVRDERIKTQRQLVERLGNAGFECTQATVSRDIAVMGLEKVSDGGYVLPEDLHLRRMLTELVTDVVAAENLIVVKCMPGGAQGVGAALDAAEVEHVVGSIAGDDTVLLIACSVGEADEVVSAIGRYRS
jgi:transcriptional regulator of arginine metabolism